MAWSSDEYRPSDWGAIRHRVLKRDQHRCYKCDGYAAEVDHVIPASRGGSHEPDNLAAICSPCHRAKTQAEAAAARKAIQAKRQRLTRPHPGDTGVTP